MEQIRLLKLWKNGDVEWPVGQILQLDEGNAKRLVDDGIAEKYEPEANDIIEVSPVKADSGLTKDGVEDIVNEVLSKNSQFLQQQENGEDDILKTGGFKSLSHFAFDVYKATASRQVSETMVKWNDVIKASGMSEGIDADGGFAVPTEYRNTLMSNALEASVILNRTTKIPMATNSIEIPVIKESTHAGSIYGGIIVYRVAEAGSVTASKPQLGKVRLTLSKIAALAYATAELLEDSPISMEPLLGKMFGEAIGFQLDEDIINGTGVGQMLGVMNAPCLVSVAKESGQSAATIETQNILKMWARMMSRSQGNALWIANMDCFPQLASLTMNVGTGGAPVGLLQTNTSGVTGSPHMTLLGKAITLTEHCQTLGTTGDIILGDYGQYLVGQKAGGGVSTASSIHLKFVEDEVAFRFTIRVDGQPWQQSALTPKHGTNTLSPFIALNSRS